MLAAGGGLHDLLPGTLPDRSLSGNELCSCTIPELKEMCRNKGLAVSGTKGQLLSRLLNADRDENSAPSTFNQLNLNFPTTAGPWMRACVSRWKLVAPFDTEVWRIPPQSSVGQVRSPSLQTVADSGASCVGGPRYGIRQHFLDFCRQLNRNGRHTTARGQYLNTDKRQSCVATTVTGGQPGMSPFRSQNYLQSAWTALTRTHRGSLCPCTVWFATSWQER